VALQELVEFGAVALGKARGLGHVAAGDLEQARQIVALEMSPSFLEREDAADIVAQYEKSAAMVVPAVRAKWSDAQLGEMIPMYGEQWPRGTMLNALIAHQTHHRGQMTVLMRQAGVPVPGMYGPSKEEWAAMGMPAQP